MDLIKDAIRSTKERLKRYSTLYQSHSLTLTRSQKCGALYKYNIVYLISMTAKIILHKLELATNTEQ